MKKDDYSSEESSKTFNCRPKFQLIPNKFITQDNPYFSAFSQRRFKILSSKDISHVKKTLKMENELDKTQNGKGKPSSLLMSRKINEFNVLQGVLQTRKSKIKKIKLKQFYFSEYEQNLEEQECLEVPAQVRLRIRRQNKLSLLRTLSPKNGRMIHNNKQVINRKKILPVKLRAKSYTTIANKFKNDLTCPSNNEKSLCIQSTRSISDQPEQKCQTIEFLQKERNSNSRTISCSQKLNSVAQIEQSSSKVLGDASSKLNKNLYGEPMEKGKKELYERNIKRRKRFKNQSVMGLECHFDLNPWTNLNNYEDKQNDFFLYR